jgi:hypothetical protein
MDPHQVFNERVQGAIDNGCLRVKGNSGQHATALTRLVTMSKKKVSKMMDEAEKNSERDIMSKRYVATLERLRAKVAARQKDRESQMS